MTLDGTLIEKDEAPIGCGYMVLIIVFSCLHIFLRLIFLSMADLGKMLKVESITENTEAWPFVIFGQTLSEIFSTIMLVLSVFFLHKVERLVEIKGMKL